MHQSSGQPNCDFEFSRSYRNKLLPILNYSTTIDERESNDYIIIPVFHQSNTAEEFHNGTVGEQFSSWEISLTTNCDDLVGLSEFKAT